MANKNLFSKEALAKLRSPERLDAMYKVTTSANWLVLFALGVLMVSIIMWSIFGAMVEKINGTGIIMDSAGIERVTAIANGKVEKIYVDSGSVVHKGDVLAELILPETEMNSMLAQSNMKMISSEREVRDQLARYDSNRLQQDITGVITATCDGIIEEVAVKQESAVYSGNSLFTIRRNDGSKDLMGVFYISAMESKYVEPGTILQLVPSGFDGNNDGSVMAVVRHVSQYPVSSGYIANRVGNQELANALLQANNNSVCEVTFELVKDAEAPSGYLWTSLKGPDKQIVPGSMVTGFAIKERIAPIEKVFYKVKNVLRSR